MVENDFKEDRLFNWFVVVVLGEPEEQCRDEVIEYFIIELLLCPRCETTVDGHVYYKNNCHTRSFKRT